MNRHKRAPWRAQIVLLFSAGALLQGGGCTVDANETITGLFTTIGGYFINSYVTGLFGVGM